MTDSMQTYKQFYKHAATGEIYAIERNRNGTLIGSCGPLNEPLQDPDSYDYTTELNDWLETQNDKLILI